MAGEVAFPSGANGAGVAASAHIPDGRLGWQAEGREFRLRPRITRATLMAHAGPAIPPAAASLALSRSRRAAGRSGRSAGHLQVADRTR